MAWKGRRMPGGCSSPFMNSQAPISSPDSAAILSEIRTGGGLGRGQLRSPAPGGFPTAQELGARAPNHRACLREEAGAQGGGSCRVSAWGAPGTFRGEPNPLGAGRTRPGL